MKLYRVYRLDKQNSIMSHGVNFQCEDDDAAVGAARRTIPYGPIEIWQGDRFVTLEAEAPAREVAFGANGRHA